jgi:hypothetical protein
MRMKWAGYVALITMKESKLHSEKQTSYDKPVTMDDKQIRSGSLKRIYWAHNHALAFSCQ